MITAISRAEPQARTPSGIYLKPTTWISVSQWWDLFRGVRLLLPACHLPSPPPGWMRLPDSIECRELYSFDRPLNYWQRRQAVYRNGKKLLQDVDLLYFCMPTIEAYYLYRIAKKRNIPTLVELHGDWSEGALAQTDETFLRSVTRKWRAKQAFNIYKELAAYSIAVSTIGPVLAEKYVPKGKPLLITTNHTVEEKDMEQRTDFTLKSPPRILFVGGLESRKGLKCLFEAFSLLISSGQDFEFVAVGEGPERAPLQQYAEKMGFADRVRFAGVVQLGPQLFEEFRKADVFVLPSISAEGVPRVIQEAQSMGCPVIATDIGSTRWQLREGAGIVVPPSNPPALKEALQRFLNDESLRRSLSQRGSLRAAEHSLEKQREGIAKFVRSTVPSKYLVQP